MVAIFYVRNRFWWFYKFTTIIKYYRYKYYMSIGVDNGHNVTENALKKMLFKVYLISLCVSAIYSVWESNSIKSGKTHNGQLVLL